MQLTVDLVEHVSSPIPGERFAQVLEGAYRSFANTPATIELVLTDDAEMRTLNRSHRDKDATTDVLSFPTAIDSERGSVVPHTGESTHLGTIVISLDEAKRHLPPFTPEVKGGEWGNTLEDVVLRLAEHGLRHLLGHDHDEAGAWISNERS